MQSLTHFITSLSEETAVDAATEQLHIGNRWMGHSGMNLYDNTARLHDPLLMRFHTPDPKYTDYGDVSAWNHCMANPVNILDLDGEDWYISNAAEYAEGAKPIIKYTHCNSSTELNKKVQNAVYLGAKAVVIIGSMDEKLGKNDNIYGEGAKTAVALIYGDGGEDDVTKCTAFTLTSNYEKFGAIADGKYDVSYIKNSSKSSLPKNYILNNGDKIKCINNENRSPKEYFPASKTEKNIYLFTEQIIMVGLVKNLKNSQLFPQDVF